MIRQFDKEQANAAVKFIEVITLVCSVCNTFFAVKHCRIHYQNKSKWIYLLFLTSTIAWLAWILQNFIMDWIIPRPSEIRDIISDTFLTIAFFIFQMMIVMRFSAIVHEIRRYPMFVDYLCILIVFFSNFGPLALGYISNICLINYPSLKLLPSSSSSSSIPSDDVPPYCIGIEQASSYSWAYQSIFMPIIDNLLGLLLLIFVKRIGKISNLLHREDRRLPGSLRINRSLYTFIGIWIAAIWIAGGLKSINHIIVVSPKYDVNDRETNQAIFSMIMEISLLLTTLEFSLFYPFMLKITILIKVGVGGTYQVDRKPKKGGDRYPSVKHLNHPSNTHHNNNNNNNLNGNSHGSNPNNASSSGTGLHNNSSNSNPNVSLNFKSR